jgi:hypothetical protein
MAYEIIDDGPRPPVFDQSMRASHNPTDVCEIYCDYCHRCHNALCCQYFNKPILDGELSSRRAADRCIEC